MTHFIRHFRVLFPTHRSLHRSSPFSLLFRLRRRPKGRPRPFSRFRVNKKETSTARFSSYFFLFSLAISGSGSRMQLTYLSENSITHTLDRTHFRGNREKIRFFTDSLSRSSFHIFCGESLAVKSRRDPKTRKRSVKRIHSSERTGKHVFERVWIRGKSYRLLTLL